MIFLGDSDQIHFQRRVKRAEGEVSAVGIRQTVQAESVPHAPFHQMGGIVE